MKEIVIKAKYNNEVVFSQMIETIKNMLLIIQASFSLMTFIVLEIDGIRLKIEVNSDIHTLHEQYEERMFLFQEGRQQQLNAQYRSDGIL
jgi:hypothetical protein